MSNILDKKAIEQLIQEQGLISNHHETSLQPASYELRIGSYIEPSTGKTIDLRIGESVEVFPGSIMHVGPIEKVLLNNSTVGFLHLRSTYARRGFVSWSQGLVDPGYRGGLTIVLHNLSGQSLPLIGGDRICHIVFHALHRETNAYTGRYQGSEGPTQSRY